MLEPTFTTAPVTSKMTLASTVVKIDSKIIILLCWSKSVKQYVEKEKERRDRGVTPIEELFELK